jgi:hypothetical protein
MTREIPPDLAHIILSYFSPTPQNIPIFLACSLVSRSFLFASRSVLFKEVCISNRVSWIGFHEREWTRDGGVAEGSEKLNERNVLDMWKELHVKSGFSPFLGVEQHVQRLYLDAASLRTYHYAGSSRRRGLTTQTDVEATDVDVDAKIDDLLHLLEGLTSLKDLILFDTKPVPPSHPLILDLFWTFINPHNAHVLPSLSRLCLTQGLKCKSRHFARTRFDGTTTRMVAPLANVNFRAFSQLVGEELGVDFREVGRKVNPVDYVVFVPRLPRSTSTSTLTLSSRDSRSSLDHGFVLNGTGGYHSETEGTNQREWRLSSLKFGYRTVVGSWVANDQLEANKVPKLKMDHLDLFVQSRTSISPIRFFDSSWR